MIVPRANDKRTDPDTGERKRFSSAILPPWARKTPKVTDVLALRIVQPEYRRLSGSSKLAGIVFPAGHQA